MISYMSVDRLEGSIAVCELEMIWVEESKTEDFWKKETKMVDVPMKKFVEFAPVSAGDIFVAMHNDGTVVEICKRADDEKARRAALLQTII